MSSHTTIFDHSYQKSASGLVPVFICCPHKVYHLPSARQFTLRHDIRDGKARISSTPLGDLMRCRE